MKGAAQRGPAVRKLYTHTSLRLFFALCWFGYFSTYLGRLNLTACIAEISASGLLSRTQLGYVSGAFFVCYGVGQLFSGLLADRLCPRRLVGLGLLGSAAANAGMALAGGALPMALLWGANGLVQALTWAPLVRTVTDLTRRQTCARICLNLATTTPAGTLAAYSLCVGAIALGSWRGAFWAACAVLAAAGVLWLAGVGALQRTAARDGIPDDGAGTGAAAGPAGLRPGPAAAALVPLGLAATVHGLLREGITTWAPSYLQDTFGFPPAVSVALTMVLPLVNLFGVYLANAVNVRWLRSEPATALACFGLCGACLLGWLLAGQSGALPALMLLAAATTCMTGVSTMLLSLLPLRFTGLGLAATVTGVLNALTYAGSALSGVGFGAISERWGWHAVAAAWCASAAAGALLCAAGRRPWRALSRALRPGPPKR